MKEVTHCKVIGWEAVTAQHRVLVTDWEVKRGKKTNQNINLIKDQLVEIERREP